MYIKIGKTYYSLYPAGLEAIAKYNSIRCVHVNCTGDDCSKCILKDDLEHDLGEFILSEIFEDKLEIK